MLEQKRITDVTQEELTNFLKSLIGLDREKALAAINKEGFRSRIISVDGSAIPYRTHFDDTRVNLELIRGKVTRAYPG